ncbi:MAG: hypothetical protein JWN85_5185 [Gammaproteobacteria bacterium]|nr:hypothetical protein [Gammaproteobacteria bacterium]
MPKHSTVLAVAVCLAAPIGLASAEDAQPIFAQKLVDEAKAHHPDVVTIGIHAKPPGTSEYIIIAHTNRASVGHKSEGADLVTLKTGKTDGPNPLPGGVFDVGVTLKDHAGKKVGFVAVHFHPAADSKDPKADALHSVLKLRDELAQEIPSEAALFKAGD